MMPNQLKNSVNKIGSIFYNNNCFEVQGHKMFLDPRDSLHLSVDGIYEPIETEFFCRQVKKNSVVIDIGANIGYYTLIAARSVGENGKVFSFEPNPVNFSILRKNIALNGYKNVEAVPMAVSNFTGKTKLYLSEDNSGDHRIYDSHDGRQYLEIKTIALDDYFEDSSLSINLVKIDAQGCEYAIFQGAANLFKKNDVKVIVEFWPVGLKMFGTEPEEFLNLLSEYGFHIFKLEMTKRKIEPIKNSELLKEYTPQKGNWTNLFLQREE